jgi:hypothetical protein
MGVCNDGPGSASGLDRGSPGARPAIEVAILAILTSLASLTILTSPKKAAGMTICRNLTASYLSANKGVAVLAATLSLVT